ncbi:MAG TPA: presenilin family intramembrane aspartyl protease [archaeon]|nr:presenilin family intramembrane aspartyl protease [archaeon]
MKHTWNVTLILAGLFLASQLLGLALLYNIFSVGTDEFGRPVLVYQETILGPRPDIQGPETLILLLSSVAFGTVFILLVIRFGRFGIWKAFFFFTVFITIWVALAVMIDAMVALGIAVVAAALKVRAGNVFIHNLTEPFLYAGMALILVPLLSVPWALALLAVISIYDYWAVFRSKHMVTIAKGLQKSTVFAGLSIPYKKSGEIESRYEKSKGRARKGDYETEEVNTAGLGGGDIAFPLLFTGTVLQALVLSGLPKASAFLLTLILPAVLTITLVLMLLKASKGKFYPAMPVLSAGCLIGYLLVLGAAWVV